MVHATNGLVGLFVLLKFGLDEQEEREGANINRRAWQQASERQTISFYIDI